MHYLNSLLYWVPMLTFASIGSDLSASNHLIPVFMILVVSYVVWLVIVHFIERVVRRTIRPSKFSTPAAEKQREDTVITILKTALKVLLIVSAGLMVLGEFGVNIGPLLAGAGVAGVALGFGAQSMVKDVLAGLFIIAEDQYRVGDVVEINKEIAGVVEHLSLRVTVMRDLDGVVHHISNGNIQISSNMTNEYANVNLNIGVGYDTDLEKLEEVIEKVGDDIFADDAWKGVVIEPARLLRVDQFADSAIIIKIICKTAPIRQWEVKGEILKRLKIAFDKEGISIPFPQRVIHQAPGAKTVAHK